MGDRALPVRGLCAPIPGWFRVEGVTFDWPAGPRPSGDPSRRLCTRRSRWQGIRPPLLSGSLRGLQALRGGPATFWSLPYTVVHQGPERELVVLEIVDYRAYDHWFPGWGGRKHPPGVFDARGRGPGRLRCRASESSLPRGPGRLSPSGQRTRSGSMRGRIFEPFGGSNIVNGGADRRVHWTRVCSAP
jgi:hypothetical protein